MRPSDMPPAERFPHGTRARYVAGCRCDDCRTANREYARKRTRAQIRGDWNGLVDASAARTHLERLSNLGVGRRAVGRATGVADTVLSDIRSGRKTRIRARTERDILAVDDGARSDHAFVPAKETWKRIRELIRKGYTKGEISVMLGNKTRALQIRRDVVLVRTEHTVKKLHQEIMSGIAAERELPKICTQCGYSHEGRHRLATLRTLLPAKFEDIKDAWPCFYGGIAGDRQLYRDLHWIGADSDDGVWSLPQPDPTKEKT